MTDSDFTLNDWRRRLGGGGAGHYSKDENVLLPRADMPAELRAFLLLLFCMQSGQAFVRGEQFPFVRLAMDSSIIVLIEESIDWLAASQAASPLIAVPNVTAYTHQRLVYQLCIIQCSAIIAFGV